MLVKGKRFHKKFFSDFKHVYSGKISVAGSYKIKKPGEIITDIDISLKLQYGNLLPKFIELFIKKAEKNNFIFIGISAGDQKEFEVPWTIDTKGGCDFNLEQSQIWFNNFAKLKLIPDSILKNIEIKLTHNMKIKDIIDIEKTLHSFGKIIWTLEDISKGYVIKNNIKYNFLETLKDGHVLKFAYIFENKFCPVDIGVLQHGKENFTYYYSKNYYKIMKLYRWKLDLNYLEEYLNVMNQITYMIAVKYQIELYDRLKMFSPVYAEQLIKTFPTILQPLNLEYSPNTKQIIDDYVDNYLAQYVEYFYNRLKPEHKYEFLLYYKRGLEAQIPVSQEEIRKREKKGLKCPFFPTNAKEFNWILELSLRSQLDFEQLMKCILDTAEKFNIPVNDVIKTIGRNELEIQDNSIIYKNRIITSSKDIKYLQTLILTLSEQDVEQIYLQ